VCVRFHLAPLKSLETIIERERTKIEELPFDGTEARVALRSRFFFFFSFLFALNKNCAIKNESTVMRVL